MARRERIIKASERCDLFLVCTSTNSRGQVEVWGATRGMWAQVSPVVCGGGCRSVMHYIGDDTPRCTPHGRPWTVSGAVASLYAENGIARSPGAVNAHYYINPDDLRDSEVFSLLLQQAAA